MADAHLIREGDGEPLVLIHGVGHYGGGWQPVIDNLRWDFDVIAVDSPGFGQSPDLAGDHTIGAYTEFFARLFDDLGLDRPHVAGNSMGGGIALELARRGAVRSATAISPVGFWTPRERAVSVAMLRLLIGAPLPLFDAILGAASNPVVRTALAYNIASRGWRMPAEELARTFRGARSAPAMQACLSDFDRYDFDAAQELDGTPVTVAWGSRDALLFYPLQAPRARSALPRATHLTLPGLGHTPFYDDPGLVAGAIRAGTRG